MPSSPLGHLDVPESVQDREEAYIEFSRQREKAKAKRTLEWACAAARVTGSGKENRTPNGDGSTVLGLQKLGEEAEGDDTDEAEEAHEAITPNSSLGHGHWVSAPGLKATVQDEDMMAAYVLCKLGLGCP